MTKSIKRTRPAAGTGRPRPTTRPRAGQDESGESGPAGVKPPTRGMKHRPRRGPGGPGPFLRAKRKERRRREKRWAGEPRRGQSVGTARRAPSDQKAPGPSPDGAVTEAERDRKRRNRVPTRRGGQRPANTGRGGPTGARRRPAAVGEKAAKSTTSCRRTAVGLAGGSRRPQCYRPARRRTPRTRGCQNVSISVDQVFRQDGGAMPHRLPLP